MTTNDNEKKKKPGARKSAGNVPRKPGRAAKASPRKSTTARRNGKTELRQVEDRIERRLRNLERRGDEALKQPPPRDLAEEEGADNGDFEVSVKKLHPEAQKKAQKGFDFKSVRKMVNRVLSLVPGSRPHDFEELIERLESMDEFGKASDIETKLESLMMFLYEKYWRVETSGLENIPHEGRTLIVSNHSGVLPFDGAMIATAIYKFHPAERHARFLIEDWFGQLPFATQFMNAVGQVRACQENAERLLRHEQLVGVFPEGIKGMAKGFKNRYNLARFGRGGVIRLAIRTKTPVIPCAVVGAEEIYIVLGYANWLGKMFGLPLFPITATFPWLGLLGMIPLPTKWSIQFGQVIRYDEYADALGDNVVINRLNRQLRSTIQEMVDSSLKKRRSLFFG
jgi:1-acyl-sn-glycerol-3-phosphate acyltransferase